MNTDMDHSLPFLSMTKTLSVPELIRAAETLKQNAQHEAIEALYKGWIANNSSHPLLYAVLFNYSVVLTDGLKLAEARECLEQALRHNADFLPAHINLGRVLERQGSSALAVVQWSIALSKLSAVDGTSITYKTTALNQSARALETASQDDAAEALLRQSLELDSQQREVVQHLVALRQRQCEWPSVLPLERADHRLQMRGLSPLSAAALTDDPLYQLGLAHHYNLMDVGKPSRILRAWPKAVEGAGPIKVAYLSSDLREHAVGFLMTDVPPLHDRSKVEVFAYYCGPPSNDPLHHHFRSTVDHFTDISQMSDEAAAQKMLDDGIQILVDLNGYTREARLKLVAMRPAPLIVNWLGYPGTMASPYHHYLIADPYIIPPASEVYYTEQVLHLPCYQPSQRNRTVAKTPTRREVGLPDDAFVYCCFNGAHKLTSSTFDRWLAILSRVNGSVLWLLGTLESAQERLRAYAERKGVSRDRLVFADKLANPAHLARYPLADLFLDTTPYGAHTTASDALFMGVPVLTYSGRSFASRVCGSLARAASTPEMVFENAEEFLEAAVRFGNDRESLREVRERLQQNHSNCTLFDMPRLVASLEALYETIWQRYQQGIVPKPNLHQLDVLLEIGGDLDPDGLEMQRVPNYHEFWIDRLQERSLYRPLVNDERLRAIGFEVL